MAYGNTPSCGGATLSSVKFTSGCWVIYKTTSICALFIMGTGGDQPHQAAAAREEREGPVIDAPLCAWHRGRRWIPRAAELGRAFIPVSAVAFQRAVPKPSARCTFRSSYCPFLQGLQCGGIVQGWRKVDLGE